METPSPAQRPHSPLPNSLIFTFPERCHAQGVSSASRTSPDALMGYLPLGQCLTRAGLPAGMTGYPLLWVSVGVCSRCALVTGRVSPQLQPQREQEGGEHCRLLWPGVLWDNPLCGCIPANTGSRIHHSAWNSCAEQGGLDLHVHEFKHHFFSFLTKMSTLTSFQFFGIWCEGTSFN